MTTSNHNSSLPDDALVRARLVDDEESLPNDLMEAQMVDLNAEENRQRELKRRRKQFRIRLAMIVCLCVAAAITLSVVLSRPQIDPTEAPTTSLTGAPTSAPTSAPTNSVETIFRESLPDYTQASLLDPESPQFEAFAWLTRRHPDFEIMEDWRRNQLFCLSLLLLFLWRPKLAL